MLRMTWKKFVQGISSHSSKKTVKKFHVYVAGGRVFMYDHPVPNLGPTERSDEIVLDTIKIFTNEVPRIGTITSVNTKENFIGVFFPDDKVFHFSEKDCR